MIYDEKINICALCSAYNLLLDDIKNLLIQLKVHFCSSSGSFSCYDGKRFNDCFIDMIFRDITKEYSKMFLNVGEENGISLVCYIEFKVPFALRLQLGQDYTIEKLNIAWNSGIVDCFKQTIRELIKQAVLCDWCVDKNKIVIHLDSIGYQLTKEIQGLSHKYVKKNLDEHKPFIESTLKEISTATIEKYKDKIDSLEKGPKKYLHAYLLLSQAQLTTKYKTSKTEMLSDIAQKLGLSRREENLKNVYAYSRKGKKLATTFVEDGSLPKLLEV